MPWVAQNLRTINRRAARAIAGLSQGGFCSLSYAARHPDLFSVALGYSGAPEIYYDKQAFVGARAIINATEVGLDNVPPDTFFGDPATDAVNWAAHDPATLAENLVNTRMYMYWGNGQLGPYDSGPNPGAQGIEAAVDQDNQYFEARLNALKIPAYFDPYGNGTHSWPYWARDLRWSIDKVIADFAHPAPQPSQITYTSADNRYAAYGWTVTTHRAAREFSTLEHAGVHGFELAGSGSATVLTPAAFRRRSEVRGQLPRSARRRVEGGSRQPPVVASRSRSRSAPRIPTRSTRPRRWRPARPSTRRVSRSSGPADGELAATDRARHAPRDRSRERADRRDDRALCGDRQGAEHHAHLARHRRLFRVWLLFAGALMPRGKLPRAHRAR